MKLAVLVLACMLLSPLGLGAKDKDPIDHEIYYILQKGFISVAGKTNFFDFKGKALRHEGQLEEYNDTYTGSIILRFTDLHFDLPGVQGVLEDESYINAGKYPEIKIDLHQFSPSDKPKSIKSQLRLRGVERPIDINTKFDYLSPVVKVEGEFVVKQSEFGITPYSKGLMDMNDELQIKFKVFFCEFHTGDGGYHQNDTEQIKKLMDQENIAILNKEGFFGCSELAKEQQ